MGGRNPFNTEVNSGSGSLSTYGPVSPFGSSGAQAFTDMIKSGAMSELGGMYCSSSLGWALGPALVAYLSLFLLLLPQGSAAALPPTAHILQ